MTSYTGSRDGAGGDQSLLPGVDPGVEPFECPGSQQGEVAGLGEDDLVHGLELAALDDGDADVSSDVRAIGHHEELISMAGPSDAQVHREHAHGRGHHIGILRGGRAPMVLGGLALLAALALLSGDGIAIRSVEIIEPDLEAVFLHLTGKALRD